MIDSPTVTTDHDDGVDAGPLATLPSDVASGSAMADRARLLAALDGLDPAGSAPVGWLISFLRRLGSDPTVELTFDGTTASVPPKALTLRSVARRCDRSPGTVGTWQRTWRQLGLVQTGPSPTIDVARLREVCGGMLTPGTNPGPPPSPQDPGKDLSDPKGEELDVLLRHLRLAAAADEGAAVDVITDLVVRLVGGPARQIARSSADPLTDREIERSLDPLSLSSDTRDARMAARPIARPDGPSTHRTTAATLELLTPLLETVDRFGLAPLTDRGALTRALRPYSDEQVLYAQSVILRQCRTQRNITSPIGLLVRHAQQRSPEYFELPANHHEAIEVLEPPPPEDHGPPPCPEQRAAAAARARGELATAARLHRRPVHSAKGHAAP